MLLLVVFLLLLLLLLVVVVHISIQVAAVSLVQVEPRRCQALLEFEEVDSRVFIFVQPIDEQLDILACC